MLLIPDMMRELAIEAWLRDMKIGEVVSELIVAVFKRDLVTRCLIGPGPNRAPVAAKSTAEEGSLATREAPASANVVVHHEDHGCRAVGPSWRLRPGDVGRADGVCISIFGREQLSSCTARFARLMRRTA